MTEASPKNTPRAQTLLAGGSLVLLAAAILGGGLFQYGLWEPWETSWAQLAKSTVEGDLFTPTLQGHPVPRPPLPLWLIGWGQASGEWAMRLPMAAAVVGGVLALFVWLKDVVSLRRAWFASFAALTTPSLIFGAGTLNGQGLSIGLFTATFAVYGLALAKYRRGQSPSVVYGLSMGLLSALNVWSFGVWAVYLPLFVIAGVGLIHRSETLDRSPGRTYGAVVAGLLTILAGFGWLAWQEWNEAASQIFMLSAPAIVASVGLYATRHTRAVKALGASGLGAITVVGALSATALAALYGRDVDVPSVTTSIAGIEVLLNNYMVNPTLVGDHIDFDFWLRQVGFGLVPWTVVAPVGLAWLVRHELGLIGPREAEEAQKSAASGHHGAQDMRRLLLMWTVGLAVMAGILGSAHGHILIPGLAPIAVAGALRLADAGTCNEIRATARWALDSLAPPGQA